MNLTDTVYRRFGRDVFGDGCPHPPGDWLEMRLGPADRHPGGEVKPIYVVQTSNDGSELWIGTDEDWCRHCRHEDARRLAWFVLWTWWLRGTWCGLRRRLWYWALRRKVAQDRRLVAELRAKGEP